MCSKKGKELESFSGKEDIGDGLEICMVKSAPLITRLRYSVAATSVHAHFVLSLHSDSGPTSASKILLRAYRRRVSFIKFPLLTPMQDLGPWKNFLATQVSREGRCFYRFMKTLDGPHLGMVRESPSYASGLNHLERSFPAHERHSFFLFPEAEETNV